MLKKKVKPNNTEKRLVKASDIKRERRIKKINKTINILLIVLLPIILVFCATVIQRENVGDSISWMLSNPGIVLINMAIIFIAFFALLLISRRPALSFAISSIAYLALPIISKIKYDIRGEVLLLNDLSLINTAGEIASFAELSDELWKILIRVIAFVLIATLLLAIRRQKANRKTSLVFLLLSIAFIAVVMPNKNVLKMMGINENVRFSPNIIHEKQGTILGLYSNFEMNKIEEPSNYSKSEIYKILNKIKENDETNYDSFGDKIVKNTSARKPNIIMIMSESFCDPCQIEGVEYSKDPISYIRKLQQDKNTISGKLITSTFAGGTSNIEYEAFTGTSCAFMPYGIVPYTDIGNGLDNVQTIQKVLKKNGYTTTAIHSYTGDFYNRNKVYPIIGFDDFIEDKELKDVNFYGKYVGDATVYNNIIETLKNKKANEPAFIWALTMQNHSPYTVSSIGKEAIYVDVFGEQLSETSKDKLTAYVNEIYESDRRLELLIDYINSSKEPTILMFYGDHMPALYDVYYDTKMISTQDTTKWTPEEMLKMHTVPYFIYQNFDNENKVSNTKMVGAVKLGNMLLNLSGINKSYYFRFVDTLNYTAIRDRLFVDLDGKAYDEIPEGYFEKINEQKTLQYDMLYGKNYVAEFDDENL